LIFTAYGETLAAELRPLNIRVTIAVPGTMKSDFNNPSIVSGRFAEYDADRALLTRFIALLREQPDAERGDPLRAMDVIVDVVRGEGRAKDRAGWPLWIVLGEDAVADWCSRAEKMSRTIDVWGDLAVGLRYCLE
jgi:NAD(P)-dependent dehydrogenase (short-subunit alcohol dehydrogenase family)